ncbi:P-loop containing nucleoside triphosphate hydrolase protein [Mycena rebaudengoi]|nr:P-loop containing nucleoside triphosphate hydrolase protein [Mycena rebaudengoi]
MTETDQKVAQARKKGIHAITINADNSRTANLWKEARTTAQLVYISPEMANSESFIKLWKNRRFRARITAVIVDEAHCIHDWGDEFRPEYKTLDMLRSYTGQEVPIVACTATAATSIFSTIWTSLGFGNRPFWGLDVGCGRPNLLFLTRTVTNPKNPVLDLLNLLPKILDNDTPLESIDKMLIYFDSEQNCLDGVDTLREALPEHLRNCVYNFSGTMSEDTKETCWKGFMDSTYRIICCTEAAGMGCNVPDVKITVIIGSPKCPRSLSIVAQRWGRTARGRETIGTCIFLVPKWAFRPTPPPVGPAVQMVQTLKRQDKVKLEPKTHTESRARLDRTLEAFINSDAAETPNGRCSHKIMSKVFRPHTGLTTFTSLDATEPAFTGELSESSAYELSWTVIDLPINHRPEIFAADFINPIAAPSSGSRPTSPVSVHTDDSHASVVTVDFERRSKPPSVPKADKDDLRELLILWRTERHRKKGGSKFLSAEIALPPRQLEMLVSSSGKFLTHAVIGKTQILSVVKNWDFATDEDFRDVAAIISDWPNPCRERFRSSPSSAPVFTLASNTWSTFIHLSEAGLTKSNPHASPHQPSRCFLFAHYTRHISSNSIANPHISRVPHSGSSRSILSLFPLDIPSAFNSESKLYSCANVLSSNAFDVPHPLAGCILPVTILLQS